MIVYELTHIFHLDDGMIILEPLGLGLYTSFDSVQQAIGYYRAKPGFCDNPAAFSVRQREVQGLISHSEIFEAIVYFHTVDYESEHTIELGLYSDETAAKESLSVYIQMNKHLFDFQNLVIETIVNRCVLNRKEWPDGFSVSD